MFYKKGSKTSQNPQSEIELTAYDSVLQSIMMNYQESIIPMLLINSVKFNPSDSIKQLLESITTAQDLMIKKLLAINVAALNKNPDIHQKILEEHWMQNEKPHLTQQQMGQFTYGKNF